MVQTEPLRGLIREVHEAGLLTDGHFAFRSGMHAMRVLDRDRLLSDTRLASRMGYGLAKHFFLSRSDVVAAPSVWGAGLAQWVGFFLDPNRQVVYSATSNGQFVFSDNARRLIDGCRVLVIDNLVLTGRTTQDFVGAIESAGGTPIGLGSLADLSGREFSVPSFGLLNPWLDIHDPESCPGCASNTPLTELDY